MGLDEPGNAKKASTASRHSLKLVGSRKLPLNRPIFTLPPSFSKLHNSSLSQPVPDCDLARVRGSRTFSLSFFFLAAFHCILSLFPSLRLLARQQANWYQPGWLDLGRIFFFRFNSPTLLSPFSMFPSCDFAMERCRSMLRRENGPAGTIKAPTFPSPPIDFSR